MLKLNPKDPALSREIRDLVRAVLVPGSVSYYYDREDYEAFARLQGTRYELFGLRNDAGNLVGITQITEDSVYWGGKPAELAYSGDTRLDPNARGRGMIDQLMKDAFHGQTHPVLGAIFASNRIVLDKKIGDWKKIGINFKTIGSMQSLFLLPKKGARAKHVGFQIRLARPDDLSAMFELWMRESKRKNLMRNYPLFSDFERAYQDTPGVTLDRTLIAEGADRSILGFVTLWNQSAIRKIRVREYSGVMKWIRHLIRPWVSLPAPGGELQVHHVFQQCVDSGAKNQDQLWIAILKSAQALAYQDRATFLSVAFDSLDPVCPEARKLALFSNEVMMVLHDPESKLALTPHKTMHIEVGLG